MLESRRLRHFLNTYELGSIGQAAEKLFLTQPALSKSIRQLEDDLGVRLFDRTSLGVVPTSFGRTLAAHAKTIEAEVRRAEAALASMRGKAKGRVGVGVGPSVSGSLMPAATISLQRQNDAIELNVVEGLVDTLIPMLRRGEIDLAVGAWPRVSDPVFTTEILFADRIEVFAAAGHPLAGRRVGLPELLDHAWALPPHDQKWRQQLDELFHAAGLAPPRPAVVSNSGGYLKALMLGGGYLSFLPRQLAGAEIGLIALDTDIPILAPDISITYRGRVLGDAATGEVVQALRAAAADMGGLEGATGV